MGVSAINKIVGICVSLLIVFLLFSTLILEFFDNMYERNYCLSNSTSLVTCDDCNNTDDDSQGWDNFRSGCFAYLHEAVNDTTSNTQCWGCGNWGYRNTARGLGLLVLVLGILYFAVTYIPRKRM